MEVDKKKPDCDDVVEGNAVVVEGVDLITEGVGVVVGANLGVVVGVNLGVVCGGGESTRFICSLGTSMLFINSSLRFE